MTTLKWSELERRFRKSRQREKAVEALGFYFNGKRSALSVSLLGAAGMQRKEHDLWALTARDALNRLEVPDLHRSL